jgi:tetratricopeptide (TPR) repeat protein
MTKTRSMDVAEQTRFQTPEGSGDRLRATIGGVAIGLLFWAGCGAPQSATPTGPEVERPVERAAPERREPTAEERAAAQAEAAGDAFTRAGELYRSAASRQDRDYAAIERLLEEALALRPELADAWFNLGLLRYEQGAIDGALEAYRRAGEVDSTYTRGLANIGYIQLKQGDVSGARATFETCVGRNQIEPGCNINLAIMYQQGSADPSSSDRTAASIERLRFALGGDAMNADAYANIARIYHEEGRLPLARLVCENAILQGIDEAPLHNRLGLIALDQNDVITAYAEFQRAAQIDPDLLDAHMNIGAMALSFRDFETAAASFERVLEARPDANAVRLSYGAALRGMDRIDEAQTQYRDVLTRSPGEPGALYNLALLQQEALGDFGAACSLYQELQSSPGFGSFERRDDAQRRLANLRQLVEDLVDFGQADASVLEQCR